MKLLLATKNRTKLMLYRSVLEDIVDIFSPIDTGFFPSPFKETLNDAQKNAEMKACAYAGFDSTMFTLGEDTSLEILMLGNLPGPAVRRWGGEVSDDISDNDWIKLFREKIVPLIKNGKVECRKIHAYTLMREKEKYNYTLIIPFNIVLRDVPKNTQYLDGPLSFFLFHEGFEKYESDFNKEDRRRIYQGLRKFIVSVLGLKIR